jgi:hypothetical protein
MKDLTATLCLAVALLFGSVGMIASADSSQQTTGLIQSKINAIISNEKKSCGDNFATDQAVKLDLDLDGNIDLGILDESGFSCPEFGASYYCGSGGCSIHFITTDDYKRGLVQGWEIITTQSGERLVLMSLHGSACNEVGFITCYKVISISKGKLVYQKLKK